MSTEQWDVGELQPYDATKHAHAVVTDEGKVRDEEHCRRAYNAIEYAGTREFGSAWRSVSPSWHHARYYTDPDYRADFDRAWAKMTLNRRKPCPTLGGRCDRGCTCCPYCRGVDVMLGKRMAPAWCTCPVPAWLREDAEAQALPEAYVRGGLRDSSWLHFVSRLIWPAIVLVLIYAVWALT